MMYLRTILPCTLVFLASLVSEALALPNPAQEQPRTIQLTRRSINRTYEEWGEWAHRNHDFLVTKYGGQLKSSGGDDGGGGGGQRKRGTGTNLIVNMNADSSYYGSLAVGTPPIALNVILDTGSSDLWVADSDCIQGCMGVPTFNVRGSSSLRNLSQEFSIVYGSGRASGELVQDTVQMAGFSVANQVFAVCDTVSRGLLNDPVSGLLGLGFQSIASSGATPFWQTLVESGAWDSPVMAFQLTRFVDQRRAQSLEPGGSFTMGFVNQSLFQGEIEFIDIPPGQETYWLLPMTSLTVQGNDISLPPGTGSLAAIDTGTTLVGGPPAVIAAMYDQIPGAVPGSGNYESYYLYPCDTTVSVAMSFGGRVWTISPADFMLTQLSQTECLGAFFELDMSGSSAPAWIVGDTFLKNVYSVFRYDPPSVGFADLSQTANALSDDPEAPVPTPTLGVIQAEITAGSGLSAAVPLGAPGIAFPLAVALASVLAGAMGVL